MRAAVLGASDGLTSNLSLVMGVAGATLTGHTVLIAGISGYLFSPRGAFIQVGATLGTWMAANVFFTIIPGQRALVADGYRAEVERMQREVLDYLTQPATATTANAG